ncbi:MAG: RNA methyltransferase [Phycisphaerales bacterium]|nr:RNA methyltransferase [Phycisphaerales bacterium]
MTDNRSWRGSASIAVYGRRAVLEAIAAQHEGALRVELVRVATSLPKEVRQEFSAAARSVEAPFETTSLQDVAALSHDPRNDQGVAARVHLKRVVDAEGFAHTLTGRRAALPARVLATDGITNSQNIGMMVRAACGAGFDAVLWPKQGCPWVNGLVVKASAGTALRATIIVCDTLVDGLATLQQFGFSAIGLDASSIESIWTSVPPHRSVHVIGSEVTGLSAEVRELLDGRVGIPMAQGVESLNAATAAAVLCFAITRDEAARAHGPEIT